MTTPVKVRYKLETRENEYQQKQLLNLAKAIAKVRTKEDLVSLFHASVKPVTGENSSIILLLYNFKINQFYFWMDEDVDNCKKYMLNELHLDNDPLLQMLVMERQAKILQPDKPVSTFPKNYRQPTWAEGVREIMLVPLIAGDTLIGCIFFCAPEINFFKEKQLPLIQSMADYIAIAVSNILKNEEVTEKEKENQLLLALSNDMAKIRNKEDLRKIVDEQLKKLLSVNNISFCYLNPGGKTFGSFILDNSSPSVLHPEYIRITTAMHPLEDGVMDSALKSEYPIVFDTEALMKTGRIPDYMRMLHEVGMRQVIVSVLSNGDKAIGFLAITRRYKTIVDTSQLKLIKAVAQQLSVVLANIKANEQIELQFAEINRYKERLEEENQYLVGEISNTFNQGEIIGNSKALKDVFKSVQLVSKTQSTVLVLGETGTGKELIARAIHNLSQLKNKPLIKLNCAALAPHLIESELFGHERGAFTGAVEKRIGKFELADGSSLFLDEIGELPLELQSKLLRVIQEKEFERLGSNRVIKVNVRIIAATNRDLEKVVKAGLFRADLYFRLNVFPVSLPPLRERKEDIRPLTAYFVNKIAKQLGRDIKGVNEKGMKEMEAYSWPGNIRELEHIIERSCILCMGKVIKEVDLPSSMKEPKDKGTKTYLVKSWEEHQREYIIDVLKHCNGKVSGSSGAAALLELPATTLEYKMKKLGIKKQHY